MEKDFSHTLIKIFTLDGGNSEGNMAKEPMSSMILEWDFAVNGMKAICYQANGFSLMEPFTMENSNTISQFLKVNIKIYLSFWFLNIQVRFVLAIVCFIQDFFFRFLIYLGQWSFKNGNVLEGFYSQSLAPVDDVNIIIPCIQALITTTESIYL